MATAEKVSTNNLNSLETQTSFELCFIGPEIEYNDPEIESIVPEIESIVPEIKSIDPEMESIVPEIKSIVPEIESIVPEIKSIGPEIEYNDPEMESIVPEIEYNDPEIESIVPEIKSIDLEIKPIVPEIEYSDPEIEYSDPEIEYNDPESEYSDPEIEYSDSEFGYSDSEEDVLMQYIEALGIDVEWEEYPIYKKWTVTSKLNRNDIIPRDTDIPSQLNKFLPNMKIEALDRAYPEYVCVATILRSVGNEVLVHFDGWPSKYNYWCRYDSPEIRPVGSAEKASIPLCPPSSTDPSSDSDPLWKKGGCSWTGYLDVTGTKAAPDIIFGRLIIHESNLKSHDITKQTIGYYNDSLMITLFERCARILLNQCLKTGSCPPLVQKKLGLARMCIICKGPFFVGYTCILPWTLTRWFKSHPNSRLTVTCSYACAEKVVEYKFLPGSTLHSIIRSRTIFTFHRLYYNSVNKHAPIKIKPI